MQYNVLAICKACLDAELVNRKGYCSGCWEDVKDDYLEQTKGEDERE